MLRKLAIAIALTVLTSSWPTAARQRPRRPFPGAWVLFGLQRGSAVPLACQRPGGRLLTKAAACLRVAPRRARLRVLGSGQLLESTGRKSVQCRRGGDRSARTALALHGAKGVLAGLALWPPTLRPRWQRHGVVRWRDKGGVSLGKLSASPAWSAFLQQVRRDSKKLGLGRRPPLRIHQVDRVDLGGDGRTKLFVSVTRQSDKGFYGGLYLLDDSAKSAVPAQRLSFAHDDTMRKLLLATVPVRGQTRPLLVFYAPYYEWPAYTLEDLTRTGHLRRLAWVTSCP